MPQILRPTERSSERNREQSSLTYSQPPFLPPIEETSPLGQSFPSTNINLHRAPAFRRSSIPESYSSIYILPVESPRTITTTPAPSSHFHPYRTVSPTSNPDFSKPFETEDEDFYIGNDTTTTTTMNGQPQYYGHPTTGNSDASFASFYYNNSPVVQSPPAQTSRYPAKLISLLNSTGPSAFYAGPVRGAQAGYYSIGTDTTQKENPRPF